MAHQGVAIPNTGRVVLRVTASSASVRVRTVETEEIGVDGGPRTVVRSSTSGDAGAVEVITRSDPVEIVCPPGTDVVVGVRSGRVRLVGSFGDVRVTTRSGRVDVGDTASLDVRVSSGRVEAGDCAGECRVMSRSARVHVASAGRLHAATKSGTVVADRVDAASVHTASGHIELTATGQGDVELRSMSGSATINVTGSATPRLVARSQSGRIRNDCGEGDDFRIGVRTLSGSVSVGRG